MIIWIARNGERYGPYPVQAALAYVQQGELELSDQAWSIGQEGWGTLEELLPDDALVASTPALDANAAAAVEKLKGLVLEGKEDHAFDLLLGLDDPRIFDALLSGCEVGYEDDLDMPEWVEWENSQKLFIHLLNRNPQPTTSHFSKPN